MIPVLNPFVGIGPFNYDSPIKACLGSFDFIVEEMSDYDVYSIEDPEISIYVENGLIDSINCYEECIYKGRNIIGMHIDEFMKYYAIQPKGKVDELNFEEDNIPQYVYEFDKIGLQVWVKHEKILNVIGSGLSAWEEYFTWDELF